MFIALEKFSLLHRDDINKKINAPRPNDFYKNLPLPYRHGRSDAAAAAPPWTSLIRAFCIVLSKYIHKYLLNKIHILL
jgi:hypothetical protein